MERERGGDTLSTEREMKRLSMEREREGRGETLLGGQGALSSEVSGMLPIVLQKLKERLTRTPARTHSRIRPLGHRTKYVRDSGKLDA